MSVAKHASVFDPVFEESKANLLGLNKEELENFFKSLGYPAFRARQAWHWLYTKGVTSIDQISSFSKDLREELKEKTYIYHPETSLYLTSEDGTKKWLFKLQDGHEIETVYIPEENRGTLCISSQIGCTLTCKFCHTGTQNLVRNLSASEILSQVILVKNALDDWSPDQEKRKVTNIVMMGMGEPLYNYTHVANALKIIMDQEGLSFSKKRITLSTSGVVPLIEQCGKDLGVRLAVSLHATNDKVRDHIVPINKKYPMKDLLKACKNYPGTRNARRITFEYVMLEGVNDSEEDAKALVKLLKEIPSKVNLIPFNPWPGSFFTCSSDKQIDKFASILMKAGYVSPIRRPRGQDILAACGQLKTESKRLKRSLELKTL